MLPFLQELNIKATFFCTALFSQKSPKTIEMIANNNHEIACHGYDHCDYYDSMSLSKQIEWLKKSKSIIENIAQQQIVSFRGPALRINSDTVKALEATGFKFDSSISSQRFDGPFTSSAGKKLKLLTAHRTPYFMSYNSPFKKGKSSILEIPISAFLWSFTGTHLRLCPFITKLLQRFLMFENKFNNKPLVFLTHPQEFLEFKKGKNLKQENIFSGYLRHFLKMKNLGNKAVVLLKSILSSNNMTYNFKTIKTIKTIKI